ncbi:hypothetical protein AB0G20_20065 [Streptomyces sp. NPDC024017]|uniref:hypothetical protein n=1 Tax=Streptomyces sp. NPDC024017 TaxID=3154326 RepID=UPI0033C6035E
MGRGLKPVDFPYWRAVYDFFRRRRSCDYVREVYERLRHTARERAGRNAEPSAGIIDSQSVDASGVEAAGGQEGLGGAAVPAGQACDDGGGVGGMDVEEDLDVKADGASGGMPGMEGGAFRVRARPADGRAQ